MSDTSTFILIVVLLAGTAGFIVYYLSNQLKKMKEEMTGSNDQVLMEWLKDMKNSVEKNSDVLEKQLSSQRSGLEDQLKQQREAMGKQTKMIWERLTEAQTVIGDINKQIGGIEEFGKDIKDLSHVLRSPKLRGGLGEQFLNELLADALPKDLYKIQYAFKDGSKCDAVIMTENGIIPIDSKFSMENFKAMATAERDDIRIKHKREFLRDVKKRIDEISDKYIKPDEGTTEFALMYVPSESIYYELAVNSKDVEDYARKKSVFITSPNTLFSQLRIFLVAYQQYELHQHTSEILKALSGIKIEAEKFEGDLGILEKHVSNASKAAENVRSKFGKLFGKIEGVSAIGSGETKDKGKQKKLLK
jgi:DNA recombination protein RmuC